MRFRDRRDAGRQLADRLQVLALEEPIVLALPRGGVPVGAEVARALRAPMDVFVARKLTSRTHPELALGAIAEGSDRIVASSAALDLHVSAVEIARLAAVERRAAAERVRRYRADRPLPPLDGCDAIVVDDGLATGTTAEAALIELRRRHPRRLVLGAPVCAAATARRLQRLADDLVCVQVAATFGSVGEWYDDFSQLTDDDVVGALADVQRGVGPAR
ncbi:MAG: phosphoribosyltransferase [Acidimicrobiales bacterium]